MPPDRHHLSNVFPIRGGHLHPSMVPAPPGPPPALFDWEAAPAAPVAELSPDERAELASLLTSVADALLRVRPDLVAAVVSWSDRLGGDAGGAA